jgi:2-oxo-4-hydroxy-4-carboxy-5-ureidoimidazoline decarboxylase
MLDAYAVLNALSAEEAGRALTTCCGSSRWVEGMLRLRPFASDSALFAGAEAIWPSLERADYLEAFAHHPEIGGDLEALRAKFRPSAELSASEQAGVTDADLATLLRLRDGNLTYKARFGHVFIVCATGKSAAEMLALLEARLVNPPELELGIAAAELAKITRLRLEKLAR